MFSLGPDMSSMFISFHVPVVSGFQTTVHSEPSLNTSPGLGESGSGSARTEAAPKRTEATTTDESMVSSKDLHRVSKNRSHKLTVSTHRTRAT